MDFIEKDKQLKRLRILIKNKTEGTSIQLAKKLGVSRRTLFRLIDQLEKLDAKHISYSRTKNHYYFG